MTQDTDIQPASGWSVEMRVADPRDVPRVGAFGAAHVVDHYRPLIGPAAAQKQVDTWWTAERLGQAAGAGRLILAELGPELVGVAEWGMWDERPVIWKLYVHPDRRSRGIGRRLLQAVIGSLPEGANRLQVEHFAANERAGQFYEREGFRHVRTEHNPSNPAATVVWREVGLGSDDGHADEPA